jgi:hypothetical protein
MTALRGRADELGLTIEVGMMSFDKHAGLFDPALGSGEQQLADMVRAARAVGSPIVRCLLGNAHDRLGPVPFEQHVAECARTLKAAAPVARYGARARDVLRRLRAQRGAPVGVEALYGYEAMRVVLAALEAAGTRAGDRSAVVRAALAAGRRTATGPGSLLEAAGAARGARFAGYRRAAGELRFVGFRRPPATEQPQP